MQLDDETIRLLKKFQKAEIEDHLVYSRMAKREKHDKHSDVLNTIAKEELDHYNTWKTYTGVEVKPNPFVTAWYTLLFFICGYTFVLRLKENGEHKTAESYTRLPSALPEVKEIIAHEEKHEEMLISILDEDRLKYVGAIVLGLNDALVELTGSIAGFTFALANTRLIALSGIITGIAATLSMAASNYLAEKADNNPHALKASAYTGVAYLITVVILILPYLLFPDDMYFAALATMLISVIIIIMAFNFYVSVAQQQPFWSRFGRMAAISMGVAFISFFIGLAAKALLGVDV